MISTNKFLAQKNIGTFQPPTEAFSTGSTTAKGALSNLESLFSNIFGFLTILGGIFFIVYFLIAVFGWLTAGSDVGKVTKAQQQMLNGALGLIILVGSYAIIGVIGGVIGLDLLNPQDQICSLPVINC